MSIQAKHANFRWLSVCKPGMYLANISIALDGPSDARAWHIHADCVVDDFGDLQPICFTGLNAQGRLLSEHVR